jgi:Cu/Ag efflux protein CusF
MNLKVTTAVMALASFLTCTQSPAGAGDAVRLAQTPSTTEKAPADTEKTVGRGAARAVTVKGTIAAIDKDKNTVTLKGPKGRTVTIEVKDPSKLDQIKVGDPVVATYMEAVAFQIKKPGTATPGTKVEEKRATSKPGETPAGAIGQEVTVTATITAIDKAAHTVTIKGPEGNTETVKAKDPKNLDRIKVGDLVEITYAQALAVSLDKSGKK